MTPQNPILSLNQQGQAVALLYKQLSALGHDISPAEVQGEVFGQAFGYSHPNPLSERGLFTPVC